MTKTTPLYVTQPFLPELEEFVPYLQRIWENKQLTNAGPFHQELEVTLARYLGVEHICLFANGTIALVTALQTLRIAGEVITTPFSFVATAHSLLWNGITPVFADISEHDFNLDPERVEAAITPRTSAILPVHVYGYPSDCASMQRVADVYGLKVIYDAAHAFGVTSDGVSILRQGDLSVLSFHATKVFNTFEGGAIVCPNEETKRRVDYLKNFGFADEVTVVAPGINGKMNEVQAAFGLLQLRHVDSAIARRREIDIRYRSALSNLRGLAMPPPTWTGYNHSYFPIRVLPDFRCDRDELYRRLRDRGIFARRYFFPLISSFPMYRGLPSAAPENLPVATRVAAAILCLPIYPAMTASDVDRVIEAVQQA